MEAPQKLYLHPTAKGEVGANWLTFQLTNEDIEYIRKDALYKKIEIWLNKRHKHDRYTLLYLRKHFKEIINGILDD